jgi:hypothetical protein
MRSAFVEGELGERIRRSSVAPHVRALIAQLPDDVMVDAALPADPDHVPEAARALCKLALGRGRVRLRSVSRSEEARVLIARRDKRVVYGPEMLARGLPALVERMLVDLFDGRDFLTSLSSLARASCTLETLQRVTAHMLRASDADAALHAMLSGVTSGFGLGLNRAAIFVAEEAGLVGARGVGPATAEEAHRTWEEMEARGLTLDDFVAGGEPGGFHVRTEGCRLPEEHEVAVALAGSAPLAGADRPRRRRCARSRAARSRSCSRPFARAAARSSCSMPTTATRNSRWRTATSRAWAYSSTRRRSPGRT